MTAGIADYLLVIGERSALAWILQERRMAFPPTTRREVDALNVGDRLFLTTTRGCFHNPTRDATRVIAIGHVLSEVKACKSPLKIAGREFTKECSLSIDLLAAYLDGVELAPLIESLDAFAGSAAWGMRLRRPLVRLSTHDAKLLERRLRPIASEPSKTEATYVNRLRPVATFTRTRG
jgi:hypothetical protein